MSLTRIRALRAEVAVNEQQTAAARVELAAGGRELSEQARMHWMPRALVGVSALAGYWLESHLNAGSRADDARGSVETDRARGSASNDEKPLSATGIAGWLGLAMTAMRFTDMVRPMIERYLASNESEQPDPSANAKTEQAAPLSPEEFKARLAELRSNVELGNRADQHNHVESSR